MTKKVFLSKGTGREGESRGPLKFLLWAAVLLVVVVVAAPLFLKSTQDTKAGRSASPALTEGDRGGVVREMPRALQLMQQGAIEGDDMVVDALEGSRSLSGFERQGETTAPSALSLKPSELGFENGGIPEEEGWIDMPRDRYLHAEYDESAPAEPRESREDARGEERIAGAAMEGGVSRNPEPHKESVQTPDPAKQKAPAVSTQVALSTPIPAVSVPTPARPQTRPEPPKPSAGSATIAYSVQVGSFKEKSNALKLKKTLVDRGYQVVIRESHHPSLGLMHVVQLKPVQDMARASTLMEQVRMENEISPFLVRLTGEE